MRFSLTILALLAIFNPCVDTRSPSKIVGGRRVNITNAPYTVMIRNFLYHESPDGHICGGIIIGERHILTAAHCFEKNATDPAYVDHPSWYRIVAGENSYQADAITYDIEELYIHPNWTGSFSVDDVNNIDRADIAVIKLDREIPTGETQQSIQLMDVEPALGSPGFLFGWGYTNPNSPSTSDTLRGLTGVTVADFHFCRIIAPHVLFARNELCVFTSVGSGFCYGDSGGPLVVDGQLAGVIASGIDCEGENPGIITNVAYHKSWIEDAVQGTAESLVYSADSVDNNIHEGL